jgi:hypothetical protein
MVFCEHVQSRKEFVLPDDMFFLLHCVLFVDAFTVQMTSRYSA